MPHIVVKMIAGRSEELKTALAEALTYAVVSTLECDEGSVSVAIEDVAKEEWTQKVYVPDIQGNPDHIYKRPGYDPFE
jgi:4-oxalocrotonate tautomerase